MALRHVKMATGRHRWPYHKPDVRDRPLPEGHWRCLDCDTPLDEVIDAAAEFEVVLDCRPPEPA